MTSQKDTYLSGLQKKAHTIRKVTNVVEKVGNETVDVLDKAIDIILTYIEGLNALPCDATSYGGRPFDMIEIPGFWKEFVYPSKVSLVPTDRRSEDLLDRPSLVQNAEIPSYEDFCNANDVFFGKMKLDVPAATKVSEIRVVKGLLDILPNTVIMEGKKTLLSWDGESPFIPVPVKGKFFRNSYYNSSIEEIRDEYVMNLGSKLK